MHCSQAIRAGMRGPAHLPAMRVRQQGWDGRGGRSNLERDESTGITEAGSD